jgi:isoaspartyl peptidase/L-asparaginase-like protein (Ntn-hydrolase superfamily)
MWAIGIHGGAGRLGEARIEADCRVLEEAVIWARTGLERNAAALDVVEGIIRILEDSGAFVAGKGSSPNVAGEWELDASICDGRDQRCGAVAAMSGVYPPISIARAVMERTAHVLLAGAGATAFARECGFAEIANPATFFTPVRESRAIDHGTVGAVVLDASGSIAAGTSTGGITGKKRGRVGDSPIVGAGTWADSSIGVSCTGAGEYFLRTAAAHSVSFRCRHLGFSLEAAIAATLADIGALGGKGGMIALDGRGDVRYGFNTEAIRIAIANSSGLHDVRVACGPEQNGISPRI